MLTDVGLNRIRTLVNSDLEKGQLGTGTDAATSSDTALQTPVSATLLNLTTSLADRQITTSYTLLSTVGNGYTFTEYANSRTSANATVYDRMLFTGLYKSSTKEIVVSKRLFFKRGG